MPLATLDMQALAQAQLERANQSLARYIVEKLGPILARVPADAKAVPAFAKQAGALARESGYGDGRAYSVYVMISLLLGAYWYTDPDCSKVLAFLDDPGLDLDTRLNLALHTAVTYRKKRDADLPRMYDIGMSLVVQPPGKLSVRDVWTAFRQMAIVRGCFDELEIRHRFDIYEDDFRVCHGIAQIKRERVTWNDILARQHMGLPILAVAEESRDLTAAQIVSLGHHLVLTLAFGWRYDENALLTAVHPHNKCSEDVVECSNRLWTFLKKHRSLLQ